MCKWCYRGYLRYSVEMLPRHPACGLHSLKLYFKLMFNRSEANCPKAGFVSLHSLSGVCFLSLCLMLLHVKPNRSRTVESKPCRRSAMAVWQHAGSPCAVSSDPSSQSSPWKVRSTWPAVSSNSGCTRLGPRNSVGTLLYLRALSRLIRSALCPRQLSLVMSLRECH